MNAPPPDRSRTAPRKDRRPKFRCVVLTSRPSFVSDTAPPIPARSWSHLALRPCSGTKNVRPPRAKRSLSEVRASREPSQLLAFLADGIRPERANLHPREYDIVCHSRPTRGSDLTTYASAPSPRCRGLSGRRRQSRAGEMRGLQIPLRRPIAARKFIEKDGCASAWRKR